MNIVVILPQIVSPLQRMVAMAQRLAAAGHDITVMTPENGMALAKHVGLKAKLIPDPMINTFSPLLPRPRGLRTPALHRKRAEAAAQVMAVSDLPDRLRAIDPDLVLVNAELLPHAIATRAAGFRTALVTSMFLTPPGLQAPPLHYNQTPGQGLRGNRVGVTAGWLHYFARKSALVTRNALRDWGADHPAALRALGRSHGTNIPKRFWGWQMPYTLKLPILVMLPAALNLPVAPYPGQQFIGPMVLRDRPDRPFDPAILKRFAAGKRRVMMAFGTLVRPGGPLIDAVLQAARDNPDWQLLGLLRDAADVTDLPPNVTLVPWAPQREVLEHTDIAIIHGGAASVLECIETEVPMIVYPKATDQCGNAARVVFHGLGRQGSETDTARIISGHVDALLGDTDLPARLASMKHACALEEHANVLEQSVQTLAAGGTQ